MSIYFQYPAIEEYPNFVKPVKDAKNERAALIDEDTIIREEIKELKNFLSLKPV
ncbi:hypothetical protein [Pedobacter frigidisoli]|uniref:hypothetical protein n=1 Tax=Pedobacter frigidisoli TaxID=2530455 RepID=UPI00292CBF1D|nr:hypothetical protein [Pedobacter frigidisoli]